ncbi:MAG: triose-phosphate isomerase [Bacteroidetes bacterium]|nr:MAG: triose-phosphate isomerase [Bacteroidota bacterium]
MRKRIVAGNWKMNLTKGEGESLYNSLKGTTSSQTEVKVFVPAIFLDHLLSRSHDVLVGAQNFHPKDSGAYTGEVSISQLKDLGIREVLVGHSERREYFGESDEFLREKVDAALAHGMHVTFCCGEPLEVRESGDEEAFVTEQLHNSLFQVTEAQLNQVTIAYEPIWAIGTGKTASVEQADAMHGHIRNQVRKKYGEQAANALRILYGGSCKPDNAGDLFSCEDIDGGLIGGASLKTQDFKQIIEA